VRFALSMDKPMTLSRQHWHRFSWNSSAAETCLAATTLVGRGRRGLS
jgi:hypothetical protein